MGGHSLRQTRLVALVALAATLAAAPALAQADAHRGFLERLVAAAIEQTHHVVRYDPAYVKIPYPGGDVPAGTGTCADVVIRAYRAVGVDLQKEVHEDMKRNFSAYPSRLKWLALRPDANIDHRRVPNLMAFFARKGSTLAIAKRAEDYAPGDLVAWDLGGDVTHIGIVADRKSEASGRYMLVHNIGQGPKMEDVLFDWKVIGHYRYFGPAAGGRPCPPGIGCVAGPPIR
jgi:hypothetical protein